MSATDRKTTVFLPPDAVEQMSTVRFIASGHTDNPEIAEMSLRDLRMDLALAERVANAIEEAIEALDGVRAIDDVLLALMVDGRIRATKVVEEARVLLLDAEAVIVAARRPVPA